MPTTESKEETSLLNLQKEIAELEQALAAKKLQLEELQAAIAKQAALVSSSSGTNSNSSSEEKISLFRSLFRGREDVYAKCFESKKSGISGYQPVCRNEWVQGTCKKQQGKKGTAFFLMMTCFPTKINGRLSHP